MAITIQTDTEIDVISKQRELVQEALGEDGAYIRLKHTLKDLYEDNDIKGVDKAKLISETMAGLALNISQSAMQTGLQWAAQEKDLELKKLELQYQLDILDQQKELTEQQVAGSVADMQLKQAQRIREYGIATTDSDGNVVALGNNGKKYTEEQNVAQDTSNKVTLNNQIQAQTDEVQARTHKTVADTYVNHGIFTWTNISETGITGVVPTAITDTTLSDLQKLVSIEQAKGYSYNAWAESASGSAGFLGTLIAAETDIDATDLSNYIQLWQTSVTNLNTVSLPTIPSI